MLYEKGVNEFVEAARILKNREVYGNFFLAGDSTSVNPSVISKDAAIAFACLILSI